MADTDDAGAKGRPSKIHVTVVVANHYAFDIPVVTGKQIKERAQHPNRLLPSPPGEERE